MGIFPPWRNREAVINGGGTDGRVNGEDARKRRNDTEGEKNERWRDENNRKHEECEVEIFSATKLRKTFVKYFLLFNKNIWF